MDFEFIYKICTKEEWIKAKKEGRFLGSDKDLKDGFIHFSDKQQIKDTLNKYYSKQKDLILLEVEAPKLTNLIYEQSSDGNMFPHLYSSLDIKNVISENEIILNADGTYILPNNF